jgi:ribose transport system substrate-binding protein
MKAIKAAILSIIAFSMSAPMNTAVNAETNKAPYVVGVTIGDMGHPFHIRVWKTLQLRADELGIKLIILDDKRDLARESSNVDTLLAKKVNAVLVMAVNPQGSVPACKRVEAVGIPVLTIVDQAEGIPYVGSDLVSGAGAGMAAEYMVKKLGGKGKIVYIRGAAGTAVQNLREIGFRGVIENYPDIKVIFDQNGDWRTASGARLMSDALTRFPNKGDITAVFAHDDAMTQGALEVTKQAGRLQDIQMYGTGGNGQFMESIKAGEGTMTSFQNGELIACRAMETIYKILHGQKVEPVTSVEWTPITSENVQQFLDRYDTQQGVYKLLPGYRENMGQDDKFFQKSS